MNDLRHAHVLAGSLSLHQWWMVLRAANLEHLLCKRYERHSSQNTKTVSPAPDAAIGTRAAQDGLLDARHLESFNARRNLASQSKSIAGNFAKATVSALLRSRFRARGAQENSRGVGKASSRAPVISTFFGGQL